MHKSKSICGTNVLILYNIFICILVFLYMMESTSWESFDDSVLHDILQLMALAVAGVYIIVRHYSCKELLRLGILNMIGVLCYLSNGYTDLLMLMLAVTLLPKDELDHVLKLMLREEMAIFGGIVLASQIGLLSNAVVEIDKVAYVAKARTLGYGHPNMLAAQATSIVLLFLCVNRKRLKGKYIVGAYLAIFIIFYFSQGRTSFMLGLMAVTLIALRKKKAVAQIILNVLPWMYVMLLILLFVCIEAYRVLGIEAPIVRIVNDGLFNGRIGLAYSSLLAYPVTLLGKPLDLSVWEQGQYFALDNGQIMILIEYGIVGFVSYFWLIQKILNKIKKEKEVVFAVVTIVFLLWSMYEGTMYFIGKNFTFLFFGTIKSKLKSPCCQKYREECK